LDRFEGVEDEVVLEQKALEMEANRTFLGGKCVLKLSVVFTNATNKVIAFSGIVFLEQNDTGSPHTKYKIRSGSYDVQNTNTLKPS
jgi:hypothetical protein